MNLYFENFKEKQVENKNLTITIYYKFKLCKLRNLLEKCYNIAHV